MSHGNQGCELWNQVLETIQLRMDIRQWGSCWPAAFAGFQQAEASVARVSGLGTIWILNFWACGQASAFFLPLLLWLLLVCSAPAPAPSSSSPSSSSSSLVPFSFLFSFSIGPIARWFCQLLLQASRVHLPLSHASWSTDRHAGRDAVAETLRSAAHLAVIFAKKARLIHSLSCCQVCLSENEVYPKNCQLQFK